MTGRPPFAAAATSGTARGGAASAWPGRRRSQKRRPRATMPKPASKTSQGRLIDTKREYRPRRKGKGLAVRGPSPAHGLSLGLERETHAKADGARLGVTGKQAGGLDALLEVVRVGCGRPRIQGDHRGERPGGGLDPAVSVAARVGDTGARPVLDQVVALVELGDGLTVEQVEDVHHEVQPRPPSELHRVVHVKVRL